MSEDANIAKSAQRNSVSLVEASQVGNDSNMICTEISVTERKIYVVYAELG